MATLIVAFFAITILWLVYWTVARPFILDSVEDELKRMKTALDWAIIDGKDGATTEAASLLMKRLEVATCVKLISLSHAVWFGKRSKAELKAVNAREREIFETGPKWLREQHQRIVRLYMKAALANSPTWWLPIAFILLFAFFSRSVEIWFERTEAAAIKISTGPKQEAHGLTLAAS